MISWAINLALSSIAGIDCRPGIYDPGSSLEPMPETKIVCFFRVLPETRRSHGYDFPSICTKNVTIAVTSASGLLRKIGVPSVTCAVAGAEPVLGSVLWLFQLAPRVVT
jgi:hypothetical protein